MLEHILIALFVDYEVRIRFQILWSQITLLVKDCEEREKCGGEPNGTRAGLGRGGAPRTRSTDRAGSRQKLPTLLP